MSARPASPLQAGPAPTDGRWLRPVGASDLDALIALEQRAYAHPWTRGNFEDSLRAGYIMTLLHTDEDPRPVAYSIAMPGVDELHLLNLTVAPEQEGRGHARALLDALCVLGRGLDCASLWLEVRVSNERALRLYRRYGFIERGLRRGYYPQGRTGREDACVMSLALRPEAG